MKNSILFNKHFVIASVGLLASCIFVSIFNYSNTREDEITKDASGYNVNINIDNDLVYDIDNYSALHAEAAKAMKDNPKDTLKKCFTDGFKEKHEMLICAVLRGQEVYFPWLINGETFKCEKTFRIKMPDGYSFDYLGYSGYPTEKSCEARAKEWKVLYKGKQKWFFINEISKLLSLASFIVFGGGIFAIVWVGLRALWWKNE